MTRHPTRLLTRHLTRGAVVVTATGIIALAAGCSSNGSEPTAARASGAQSTAARSTAAAATSSPTTSPTPQHRASHTPGVPAPGSMEKPASTSGSLTKTSFPRPGQLGDGWTYDIDPGNAEDGYAGNGTPALARNPREIVQTAVPFGCARRTQMPTPSHALEVDYRLHGAKVIAVRGLFDSRAQARTFFSARSTNLAACVGRSGGAALGPLVSNLQRPAADAVASSRTPRSDPWLEVAVLDEHSVCLLAVHGDDPLTAAQTRRVVRLLRS